MFKNQNQKNDLDLDIRFLLANKRTLLAWIRTGLTLIAGGVAVTFISTDSGYGVIAGIGAICFGGSLALIGYVRYHVADASIRAGELPPTGLGGLFVVIGVIIFVILLVIVRELHLL